MPTASQVREAHALLEQWKDLSRIVLSARASNSPSRINSYLDSYLADTPIRFFHPLLLTWKGDNLFREAKFTQAIQEYRTVAREFQTPTMLDVDLRFSALEKVSLCYERLGDSARATRTLLEAAKDYPLQEPELRLAAAEIYERSRKAKEALSQYSTIIEMRTKSPRLPEMKDRAMRALGRLNAKTPPYGWDPLSLAKRIAWLLRNKDLEGLERLASKTHFSIGVLGGQLEFADCPRTLEQLSEDARISEDILVNPHDVHGMGSKRYLRTSGWHGKVFSGDVTFFLTPGYRGWEWTGLLAAFGPDTIKEILVDYSRPPSESRMGDEASPLTDKSLSIADLEIKAPWPKGRYFRAGGLWKFVEEEAAVNLVPFPANMAILREFEKRNCGWGPAGYYYDQGPTHAGKEHRFALDFTSYEQGHAYAGITGGTQVLAVANGVVKLVREWVPSGSAATDNRVVVDHYTDEELVVALIVGLFTDDPVPRSRYSARYLHLSGPNEVPVSAGLYVEQGTVLGRMDDTGNSAGPHLHFSVHENTFTGVRPTPMDGQTLLDGEDGKCLASSNEPVVYSPPPGVFHSDLCAAIMYGNDYAYFFKGNEYIKYKPGEGIVGPIKTIGEDGWKSFPSSFHSDLGAAIMYDNGYAYFFKGDKYIKYKPGEGIVEDPTIRTIGVTGWKSFPSSFHSDLDAAIMYDNGYAYFFKGDKYIKYKPGEGIVGNPTVRTIGVTGWKSFPSSFHSDLDAAIMYDNGYAYFFKGDKYIKYKPGEGIVENPTIRTIGVTGWKTFP